MNKAYFNNIRSKIIPYLRNAKMNVSIAMAWFTSSELFQELISCLRRKIKVELVLLDDPTNFMEFAPDFNDFIRAGGIFRLAHPENGFMHHKFCVIDTSTVITGSYNWTYYAEHRNIENILISDVPLVVTEYMNEFNRISSLLESLSYAPRLSWSDIEVRKDVDFRDLNNEIRIISEKRNLPVTKEIRPFTEVQIIETKKAPHARYNIGIEVYENGKKGFVTIIRKGQKLPFKSNSITLYMDSKNEKEFPCHIIYGSPNDEKTWIIIKEESLMPLAKNILNENLKLDFSFSLDINGSLRTDVDCKESNQRMMISALNSDLVKYE